MKGLAALAASSMLLFGQSGSYEVWANQTKIKHTKHGNSLAAGRTKAKARRKAQQQARRRK